MLPPVPDLAAYRALRRDTALQRPAFVAIAERHGLPASELAPFEHGSHLVWGTRRDVVKLFVPLWPDGEIEVAMLEKVSGTGIPAPQLRAVGELAGWRYAVMSRLHGVRIGDAWASLARSEQESLAFQAGQAIARIAALPVDGLEWRACHQPELLQERLARVRPDQAERGGDEALDAALRDFLEAMPALPPARSAVLHADLTDDHFLVDGTRVAGIIDFADAFVGPWTYELAAPACLLTRGHAAARDALLRGVGVEPTTEIVQAIRAWSVLHRYGHIAIMMKRCGAASFAEWLAGL